MNESKSIFKTLDTALNEQIKTFRDSDVFQKMAESLRAFSEKEQIVLNQFANISMLLVPIIVICTLFVYRYNLSVDLKIRKDIKNKIHSIKTDTRSLQNMSRASISKINILDKRALVKEVQAIAKRKKIDASHISIDNFDKSIEGGRISIINSSITFKKLTSKSFSDFILMIQTKLKSTIVDIKVTKNEKTQLLFGKINISMFSKAN